MRSESNGLAFAQYLWLQRRILVITCAVALSLAGIISLLLPTRYTATASVLIEPPAGNDARASTVVSAIYLESLKTYQLLASNDTLFQRALEDLGLRQRYPGTSLESLKRRILDVSKPANTTIIQIGATLADPKEAQSLAQYIAEHMVTLNSALDRQSDKEVLQEPQRLYGVARARREQAEAAQREFLRNTSVETFEKEVIMAADLRAEIGRDLARTRASLANYLGQLQAPSPLDPTERQAGWIEFEIAATRSRLQDLENQDSKLVGFLNEKGPVLEKLKWARETIETELKMARSVEEGAKARLGDMTTSAAFRGVRLKILDPGIVPQRPSFPNIPLNLVAALLLSLVGSIVYLALRFAYDRVERRAHSGADAVYSGV